MSCTKDMLSVLMDGIKDADMMIWYANDARENGCEEWASWFKQKAKQRYEMLVNDFEYVSRAINLIGRIEDGDDIASALKEHLDGQMDKLKTELR